MLHGPLKLLPSNDITSVMRVRTGFKQQLEDTIRYDTLLTCNIPSYTASLQTDSTILKYNMLELKYKNANYRDKNNSTTKIKIKNVLV